MHTVARHLAKKFATHSQKLFGNSFSLTNKAFYADWNGTPVAVEEFVPGEFTKYISNDGLRTHLSDYIIDILCVYYSAHSPLRLSGARYLGLFNMLRYHEI